ncbi:MAG: hypothetical protein ACREWG_04585 [Gammaproteobacteria bacterium]
MREFVDRFIYGIVRRFFVKSDRLLDENRRTVSPGTQAHIEDGPQGTLRQGLALHGGIDFDETGSALAGGHEKDKTPQRPDHRPALTRAV